MRPIRPRKEIIRRKNLKWVQKQSIVRVFKLKTAVSGKNIIHGQKDHRAKFNNKGKISILWGGKTKNLIRLLEKSGTGSKHGQNDLDRERKTGYQKIRKQDSSNWIREKNWQ